MLALFISVLEDSCAVSLSSKVCVVLIFTGKYASCSPIVSLSMRDETVCVVGERSWAAVV